ncbi:helix-turn-helix domain-containing protein [Micropruina sp.]|uniref:AlbA family DNA-binding domain-containing protein n=1 Tax=Micropruina sp. TaxID=2737536 RepID=UPI0039E53755
MDDQAVPVSGVGLTLVIALAAAWAISVLARWLLRGRARLAPSASIVICLLGMALGLILTGWLTPEQSLLGVVPIALSLGLSVAGITAYAAVAAHFQQPRRTTLPELITAGESARVEFKSTARINLHTGQKDDRMEQVIAKTACAFLNADGGTLVIGVDDAGRPLGLEADLATLKSPDADRFELWLTDLLTTTLGQNASALVSVDFATLPSEAGDRLACRVSCQPSPRPVYLRANKGAAPELWVRNGNSTRRLGVDEAAEYVMHRWPLNLGSSIAAQFKAAVRFSEQR